MYLSTFLTAISASASFFALTHAIPVVISERGVTCPAGTSYFGAGSCTSGFVGCITPGDYSYACAGSRRFFNDCGPEGDLGSFYVCVNGFKGCTTDSNICNSNSPIPPTNPTNPTPPKCPTGTWYAGENMCTSGFIGCTAVSPDVCPGPKRFWGSCPTGHGNYYVCANGFKGCTTETNICDKKI